jgi:predicted dinucleotide-binding enzyme
MRISIIGTGNMARAIGTRAEAGGHEVTIVGKDEDSAREAVAALGDGGSATAALDGDVLDADLIVLAVYYPDAQAFVESNADRLTGKAIVDITNPVNETFDALVVPSDGSATQELAKLAPGAHFVKAFNTTFAGTLEAAQVAGEPLDVFVAGDDDEAKAAVIQLAADGGLRPIDAGPAGRARDLEALGLLHMSLQDTLGTGFGSAVKVLG